jgi:hypothetical protein
MSLDIRCARNYRRRSRVGADRHQPDFHVSLEDVARWLDYAQRTNGKDAPDLLRRVEDISKRMDRISAHFAQIRDGHASL